MRSGQYTITPRDVEECASEVLQDAIRLKDRGGKCQATVLWHILLYAAARITSLFDACQRLTRAPGDDAVRQALRAGLPPIDELEERLNEGLCSCLPERWLRKTRRWRLGVDLTLIPYHGEPRRDRNEVYRGEAKSGTTHFHAYATCYVIHHGRRFTLALTRVLLGTPMPEVLRCLLKRVRALGIRQTLLLLDRGFYSVDVVRYLQAARVPFLMPMVLRGRKPSDARGPSATYVFAARKRSGWDRYSWRNAEGVRATVSVGVAITWRRRRGTSRVKHGGKRRRTTLVYAYWGLQPPSPTWVRETYRLRFGIETSYRQMNQARIRTCTRDPLLRLLFVGIALILRNVWVWLHMMLLSTPRRGRRELRLASLRLRTMLLWLIHLVENLLGTRDEADAYVPTDG
ncbi:MAG: transposase [Actinobacteria bacterium]|nr:transposase [Actinomycetota bacterium]